MTAYYNEIDPAAAAWLRELIAQGHIAPGEVDERDIQDVSPADIHGFAQCHFFAGIGVWSYSLRRAGWPDDRPVWTASCPCQPFSSAGKGAGFDDERHLWPAVDWLAQQCQPECIFGEQVASKDAEPWLDLVQADLEGLGYAFGACAFPSAGVGAPHIRDRAYWVADAHPIGSSPGAREQGIRYREIQPKRPGYSFGVDDAGCAGLEGQRGRYQAEVGYREGSVRPIAATGERGSGHNSGPGPTNGLWGDADWLFCRDGKWRPVEPGTFPLAHGAASRVGRLRGYGNAINAEAATAFIRSYLEVRAAA